MWGITVGLIVRDTAPRQTFYSTSFPLTETPISENGAWYGVNGDGSSFAAIPDMDTTPGLATCSPILGNPLSAALLTGLWGEDQTVSCTIRSVNLTSTQQDLYLFVRASVNSGGNVTGYQFRFSQSSVVGNTQHGLSRFDAGLLVGPTLVSIFPAVLPVHDGDTVTLTCIGYNPIIAGYVNGVQAFTYNTLTGGNGTLNGKPDSNIYHTGSPGMCCRLNGSLTLPQRFDQGFYSFTAQCALEQG